MGLDASLKVYEPPAGKAVEAPWGEGVAQGIVQKFTTTAVRDAMWHAPIPPGAVAATTDDDKLWFYTGSAWLQVAFLVRDVSIMMPKSGGTFTNDVTFDANTVATFYGPVLLRRAGNAPYIEFQASAAAGTPATYARYGYIQVDSDQMNFSLQNAAGFYRFYNSAVNTAAAPLRTMMQLADDGLRVYSITATAPGIRSYSPIRVGGDGPQLQVIDTNTTTASGTADCYIAFYAKGTVDAPGPMGGWMGYNGAAHLYVRNGVSGGATIISATGASGDVQLAAVRSVTFYTANAFRGLVSSTGDFLWSKAATNFNDVGVELGGGAGAAAEGSIYSTVGRALDANFLAKHVGASDAEGQPFMKFYSAAVSTGPISQLLQDKTSPVGVHFTSCLATPPSDYRLKDDLGPVPDPIARLRALHPKHLRWKASGEEFDGFLAHEVAEVVPYAVRGEKDAVYDEAEAAANDAEVGAIKVQQLDAPALLPIIVATLQDLLARMEALEEEAAA